MAKSEPSAKVVVRAAKRADARAWLAMRHELWPEEAESLPGDVQRYFDDAEPNLHHVLLAFLGDRAVGFAELNIRRYAEGAMTDRVAYLEGWFVAEDARRMGVGGALIRAAEDWARAQGCTEFASDALATNVVSEKAHKALGFTEVEVIRCFLKRL